MGMVLQLGRWSYGPDETLGLLVFPIPVDDAPKPEKQYRLWTVEPGWAGNTPFLSCIPDGQYQMQAHDTPEHPASWIISPVPGRTGILIHAGNAAADSRGCICPGITRSDMKVWQSRDAMDILNYVLQRDAQHTILIGPSMGAKLPDADPERTQEAADRLDRIGKDLGEPEPGPLPGATLGKGEPIN